MELLLGHMGGGDRGQASVMCGVSVSVSKGGGLCYGNGLGVDMGGQDKWGKGTLGFRWCLSTCDVIQVVSLLHP
jgi:hypothetical protein